MLSMTVLFAKCLCCVFLFAIVLTFPVCALPGKLSFSLHRSPWNPSSRGSSPNYICDLNPPSPLPLILRNRSNDVLSPHCQPPRHFVFKDQVRSKNAGKVKVLICWHHVTLSVDRSKFTNFQNLPEIALKSECLLCFKIGALELRSCYFVNKGAGLLK